MNLSSPHPVLQYELQLDEGIYIYVYIYSIDIYRERERLAVPHLRVHPMVA